MRVTDLRTNSLKEAIGIGGNPYFSWRFTSSRNNVVQTSYRITVMEEEGNQVWDSGSCFSRTQCFIPYEGSPLSSGKRYIWSVKVCDNTGDEGSASAVFETGILEESSWKAKWVESSLPRVSYAEYKYGKSYSPVLFERTITVKKEVKSARLYATAYGIYRLYINRKRPDDREFAPEFTSYEKRLLYQTYDITDLLHTGENILSMYVGDGWYFSEQARPVSEHLHNAPAILFQLVLHNQDGTTDVFGSDGSESCSTGFIIYSDLYQGEKQDYRLIDRETERKKVMVRDYGYSMLQPQEMPPVLPMKKITAQKIYKSPKGEVIVDFGQVLAGRAEVRLHEAEGREVTLEYFEETDLEGNYLNTIFAPQKDTVVCNGEEIVHEAFFTFHGFRYIRVSGITDIRKDNFQALLLTTQKENLSEFRCSNQDLNQLWHNIRWSQYSNMMSIPTDCPAREKAGWTGDILVYARTALLNEDVTPFLTNWLENVKADQTERGVITIVSPYEKLYDTVMRSVSQKYGDRELTGVAGWSDVIVWLPYAMYQITGNRLILENTYSAMRRWTEWVIERASKRNENSTLPDDIEGYLWDTGFHFGEWLIPSQSKYQPEDPGDQFEVTKKSSGYIAPMFGYETVRRMSVISKLLGKEEDFKRYDRISEKMKDAIQNGIFRNGQMPEELMGAYVDAFAFHLVPEDLKKSYGEKLVQLIENNHYCLDTGFLGTPFLLDALSQIGRSDLAHKLLWQNRMPSWMYEVENGATTIWEAWDADSSRKTGRYVSFDHYAFGCVDDWICRKIAGIDSDVPGFTHLIINPEYDEKVTSCYRTFQSEQGKILVDWSRLDKHMHVEIPCNVTATVTWNGQTKEIGSGSWDF